MALNQTNPNLYSAPIQLNDGDIPNVLRSYRTWIEKRRLTVQKLLMLIQYLMGVNKGTNIAKITGKSFSLLGTGIMVLGFALAPATGGASLMVSLASGTTAVCAKATSIASTWVKNMKESEVKEQVEFLLREDAEVTRKCVESLLGYLNKGSGDLITKLENVVEGSTLVPELTALNVFFKVIVDPSSIKLESTNVLELIQVSGVGSSGSPGAEGLAQVVDSTIETLVVEGDVPDASLKNILASEEVMKMSKRAFALTLPSAILSAVVDINGIVKTSIDMQSGNTSLFCRKLKDTCDILENELEGMMADFEEIQRRVPS